MFVLDVTDALLKRKIRFALVGGYALALHGIVRATMDVDVERVKFGGVTLPVSKVCLE